MRMITATNILRRQIQFIGKFRLLSTYPHDLIVLLLNQSI